jgi:hypothetical protein
MERISNMAEVPPRTGSVAFVPGEAVALIEPETVALLDVDPGSRLVADLRDAMRSGADLGVLTGILVGAGLRSLPALCLVQFGQGEARAILRGDMVLSARTTTTGVEEELRAGDVLTWVEHIVSDVERIEIRRDGVAPDLTVFETTQGIVPASRIVVSAVDGHSAPPRGEPVQETEVEDDRGADTPSPPVGGEDGGDASSPVIENATVRYMDMHEAPVPAAPGPDDEQDPGDEQNPGGEQDSHDPGGEQDSEGAQDPGVAKDPDAAQDPDGEQDPVGQQAPGIAQDPDDGYAHLFGATEHRPLSLAGIDPDESADDAPGASGIISSIPDVPPATSPGRSEGVAPEDVGLVADLGDHDGMTISLAQLRATQGVEHPAPSRPERSGSEPALGEVVHAVRCPSGHLNPPAAAACRVCGVEVVSQEQVSVPRPVLGMLRFSTGEQLPLARSMLIGRSPKASGSSQGGELPELVILDSPSKELSGTHLEIRLEGWQVLAIDRQSTNGTTVQLPGRDPQRLHPGNAVPIVPGTVIDMAEEIQFTFEVPQ